MEISLIRHGRSQLNENDKVICSEFKKWVEKYDSNGVFKELTYPLETREKVENAKIVVTSNLERAVQSAKLLKPEVQTISDSLFREVELPIASIKYVKLRPSTWTFFFKVIMVLWLF